MKYFEILTIFNSICILIFTVLIVINLIKEDFENKFYLTVDNANNILKKPIDTNKINNIDNLMQYIDIDPENNQIIFKKEGPSIKFNKDIDCETKIVTKNLDVTNTANIKKML